jgi:hypothetical protein
MASEIRSWTRQGSSSEAWERLTSAISMALACWWRSHPLRASPRQTRYRIRVLLFFTYDRKIARVAAMNASRMTLSASPCVIQGRTSASVRMTGWKYVMDGLPDPICPRTDHTQVGACA